MLEQGLIGDECLVRAAHEADLLEHPYVGVEHLELARLRGDGQLAEYEALKRSLPLGVHRRWWRPRGPRSALRRAGLRDARDARRKAEEEDRKRPGEAPSGE